MGGRKGCGREKEIMRLVGKLVCTVNVVKATGAINLVI